MLSTDSDFKSFYNMIDDFFSNDWPFRRSLAYDTFKLDIADNGKEYLVEAEVPGVNKEDIRIELNNDGRLMISITQDKQEEVKKKNFIHRERRHSSMSRAIYLADAKADGIKARLDNGILQIVVPKEEQRSDSVTIDID